MAQATASLSSVGSQPLGSAIRETFQSKLASFTVFIYAFRYHMSHLGNSDVILL